MAACKSVWLQTVLVTFPTPEDPQRAPVWDNYVVAQASASALGLIPSHVYALGVEVSGTHVTLVVQVPIGAPETDEDIDDIIGELEVNLGPDVVLSKRVDLRDARRWPRTMVSGGSTHRGSDIRVAHRHDRSERGRCGRWGWEPALTRRTPVQHLLQQWPGDDG